MIPLDNAVWHSLEGPHRRFAQRIGAAQRFDPAVAPFAALPDEPTPADWSDLGTLVGVGGLAVLFRHEAGIPDDWEVKIRFRGVQMVHEDARELDQADVPEMLAIDAQELGDTDVPEMLALVGRTEPGPFAERTIELGRYLGVRRDGALVAMAGHRLRLPGFVEISAVCTDHEHRGQGLAAGLVQALAADIRVGGDVPILHVLETNVAAIRLYESLGFVVRCALDGMVLGARADLR